MVYSMVLALRGHRLGTIVALRLMPVTAVAMVTLAKHTMITVTAPWLDQPVQLNELTSADNKLFVKVVKGDNKICRLLTGRSNGKTRVLSNTNIFGALQRTRNEMHEQLCQSSDKKQSGEPEEDLGLDAPDPKRCKQMEVVLPDTMDIEAPDVAHITGVRMTVLTAGDISPLCIEVCEANLNYLHAVIEHQLQNHEGEHEDGCGAKHRGVVWCKHKSAFRVSFMEGGKRHQRYFKPESRSKDGDQAAVDKALAFLAEVAPAGA